MCLFILITSWRLETIKNKNLKSFVSLFTKTDFVNEKEWLPELLLMLPNWDVMLNFLLMKKETVISCLLEDEMGNMIHCLAPLGSQSHFVSLKLFLHRIFSGKTHPQFKKEKCMECIICSFSLLLRGSANFHWVCTHDKHHSLWCTEDIKMNRMQPLSSILMVHCRTMFTMPLSGVDYF